MKTNESESISLHRMQVDYTLIPQICLYYQCNIHSMFICLPLITDLI